MVFDDAMWQAIGLIAVVGGIAGLFAGIIAGAKNLFGILLMGVIGGISLSAVLRIGGFPGFYDVGEFSVVWAAVGGLVLGYVVGRTNH